MFSTINFNHLKFRNTESQGIKNNYLNILDSRDSALRSVVNASIVLIQISQISMNFSKSPIKVIIHIEYKKYS
jgi:hypothetical protein